MANTKKTTKTKNVKKTETEIKEVKETKNIFTSKNFLIIIGILLLLILVIFYIYRVNKVNTSEKYNTSYLVSTGTVSLEIKNLDEVSQILKESPTEYFILITYTGNKDTYNLETGLKTIIDKYKLSDSFYYINIKDILNEDNYLTRLNNAFETDKITKVPTILYYKDGKIKSLVHRDDNNIINASDFQKLLDIYEYQGQ
mgnify:CR=1 FL=1